MPNPDTGMFMRYLVAGAYDSNIALLLTKGEDRLDSYCHLSTVLGKTSLRGINLATNLQFHYGLVNWFIGQNVMAKPTTRFVVPYLTLVGLLKEELRRLDSLIMAAADATAVPAGKALAVDRVAFSRFIEERLTAEPNLELVRGEVTDVPGEGAIIIATGPLTSDALACSIGALTGGEYLF